MSDEIHVPATVPASLAEEAPAPKRKPPLTHAQWHEIRTKAELGVARVSQLARDYGITPQSISQHLKDHKIIVGSKAASVTAAVTATTAAAVAGAIAPFVEKRAKRIEETKEFFYKAHEFTDMQILKLVGEQVKAGKPFSHITNDLKALNFAKRSLLIGRSERYRILNVEGQVEPDELPELVVTDLTLGEIEAIQRGDEKVEDVDDILTGIVGGEGSAASDA